MASTLSEADRDHPLHLPHIIPIDFSSVRSLPESHAWPEFIGCSDEENGSSIPVIDLTDPNAVGLIGHACEMWGAFQLKNHGVPLSLIEEVESEAKRFFALPSEQKLKALRSPTSTTGYGRARLSHFFSKYMWHEGFTIMGSPCEDAKNIWPDDYARFCDLMENYQKQMKMLAEKLTHLIFNFLGITQEDYDRVGATNSRGTIQLNSYTCCPDPNRAMGLAPHTDTSILTILHQSQTAGLQIFREGTGWVPVPPDPSALVVNVGDFLHIISNASIPCVWHRATVNRTQQRYSVAYFYNLPVDYVVSPRVLDSAAARFRAVTVKEYIEVKFKAKKLGEALSLISSTRD